MSLFREIHKETESDAQYLYFHICKITQETNFTQEYYLKEITEQCFLCEFSQSAIVQWDLISVSRLKGQKKSWLENSATT